MTTIKFNALAKLTVNKALDLLLRKQDEYVLDDDRLKAFRREWLNSENKENPKMVLWGQMAKHISSIYDYCNINSDEFDYTHLELWEEKILDNICYLLLLYAIVFENGEKHLTKQEFEEC